MKLENISSFLVLLESHLIFGVPWIRILSEHEASLRVCVILQLTRHSECTPFVINEQNVVIMTSE